LVARGRSMGSDRDSKAVAKGGKRAARPKAVQKKGGEACLGLIITSSNVKCQGRERRALGNNETSARKNGGSGGECKELGLGPRANQRRKEEGLGPALPPGATWDIRSEMCGVAFTEEVVHQVNGLILRQGRTLATRS